jgi:hypothetical protein
MYVGMQIKVNEQVLLFFSTETECEERAQITEKLKFVVYNTFIIVQ